MQTLPWGVDLQKSGRWGGRPRGDFLVQLERKCSLNQNAMLQEDRSSSCQGPWAPRGGIRDPAWAFPIL